MNANEKVLDSFLSLIPGTGKKSSKGWINFNCPACGDTKGRGGFIVTSSGGFRYRCFNAGCDFNSHTTGWEPDNGIGGRPRKLFQLLGGDPKNLPLSVLIKQADNYVKSGELESKGSNEKPVHYFKHESLPDDTVLLSTVNKFSSDNNFKRVRKYIKQRGKELSEIYPFMWSPKHPHSVIIPFYHYGNIVGFLGRNIHKKAKSRFFGVCPADYTFGQDKLYTESSARSVIVTEGIMDAIAVDGVACRNSVITRKQELLLGLCGRRIIMLPDIEKEGGEYINIAEKNGWEVSIPKWDRNVKDAVDACDRYGRLYTIESVINGATKNYLMARTKLTIASGQSK